MTITDEECNNVDINAWRHGYKWSINECLRLEREYDLLKLSVPEMAILHKRTINAIMCKLQTEGLDTYNNLYVQTFGQDYVNEQINKLNNLSCIDDDEDDDSDEDDEDEDDDEYINDFEEDVEYFENGENHAFVFEQVKRIHKHVTNLLGYFTKASINTKASSSASCKR